MVLNLQQLLAGGTGSPDSRNVLPAYDHEEYAYEPFDPSAGFELAEIVTTSAADAAEVLPSDPRATTVKVCVPAVRPVIVAVVPVTDCTRVPPSYTSYAVGVAVVPLAGAFHVRVALVAVCADVVTPVGVAGGFDPDGLPEGPLGGLLPVGGVVSGPPDPFALLFAPLVLLT
jgi:hypothetical protein